MQQPICFAPSGMMPLPGIDAGAGWSEAAAAIRGQCWPASLALVGAVSPSAPADGAAGTDIPRMKAKAVTTAIRRLEKPRIAPVS